MIKWLKKKLETKCFNIATHNIKYFETPSKQMKALYEKNFMFWLLENETSEVFRRKKDLPCFWIVLTIKLAI